MGGVPLLVTAWKHSGVRASTTAAADLHFVRPTRGIAEGTEVTAWPFQDPPNFSAFSTRQVFEGNSRF